MRQGQVYQKGNELVDARAALHEQLKRAGIANDVGILSEIERLIRAVIAVETDRRY